MTPEELLKEVVEPVYVVYNGLVMESTFIDKENAEQYARNKQKSHDLSGSLAAYRVEGRFTSDQVAAAIIKATKPLEDQLTAAQEEIKRMKRERLLTADAIESMHASHKDQLAKAEQRVAKYNELIYAVQTKNPDETRHQTALRYIRNAENRPSNTAANTESS